MQDKFQVQTADALAEVVSELVTSEELVTPESDTKHKTGDRVTGTVVKVGGELHLAVDNRTYMIHFTTQEHFNLKVNDQISGQLFIYDNPESVKRFGYVQLGSVKMV